ncbi:glycosyltransferase family 39 protein [Phreatobacter aquaticus]|uniref:glycosyltransferase family 39 protein n=1 Tax=Phreatobacter aquaticus TaxID=2570229 RepID=UPI00143D8D67|nr:glycosyltransferase family 39 protein [Phreatobacter aquaticus]
MRSSPDVICLLILVGSWLAAIAVVGPRGDFPIVDDWAYAVTVKALVQDHRLVFSEWIATNNLTSALWGSLFALVFGFSFETLRLSTLVAGFLGGAALYGWVRQAGFSPASALMAAFCLMFNPIYFQLSFSFMTDVPFTAALTIALALITRGVLAGRPGATAGGWAAALFALLMRQVGMAIPLAHAAANIVTRRPTWRGMAVAILPVVAFVAVQRGYARFLAETGRMPELYGMQSDAMWKMLAGPVAESIPVAAVFLLYLLLYLGLFLSPLAPGFVGAAYRDLGARWRPPIVLLVVALTVATTVALLALGHPMPIWHDALTVGGLGVSGDGPPAPGVMWVIVTVVSALSGWALFVALIAHGFAWRRWSPGMPWLMVFAGCTALIIAAPVAFISFRFDRYLVPMMPCLIMVGVIGACAARPDDQRGSSQAAFAILMAMMAAFSIAGTKDYMASRAVHDAAVRSLLDQGIPSERIDAGWVFNGYRNFGRFGTVRDMYSWLLTPDYRVASRPAPGYDIIESRPVQRWLPWAIGRTPILVMRRQAAP